MRIQRPGRPADLSNIVVACICGVSLGLALSWSTDVPAGMTVLLASAAAVLAYLAASIATLKQKLSAVEAERADLVSRHDALAFKVDELSDDVDTLHRRLAMEAQERKAYRNAEMEVLEKLAHKVVKKTPSDKKAAGKSAAKASRPRRAKQPSPMLDPGVVRDAIEEGRVDLFVQPIVSLPQRRPRFREVFVRLRAPSGAQLTASDYLDAARSARLTPAVDNVMLFHAIRYVRGLIQEEPEARVFCNISRDSLMDAPTFEELYAYLQQNGDLKNRLVFEIGQYALPMLNDMARENLHLLSGLGFALSLDNVVSLDFDLIMLRDMNVRFMKAPGDLLVRALRAEDADERQSAFAFKGAPEIRAADFKELLTRFRIDLIADRLETEKDVVEVLELNVDYGQGFLFGEPISVQKASAPVLRRAAG